MYTHPFRRPKGVALLFHGISKSSTFPHTCGAACRTRSYRRETSAGKQPPAHAWGFIKGFPPAAPAVGESRTGAALQRLCGDTSLPARVHAFPGTQQHLRCGTSRRRLSRRQTRESRKLSAHAWVSSRDSPLRRLRWANRALELRSRYFPAVRPPPPVLFSFGKYFTTIPA